MQEYHAQRGIRDHHRRGHRRSARPGESAVVQPERSRTAKTRFVSQSRHHRYFRARLERQALHHGGGAGIGTVSTGQRGGHIAPGYLKVGPKTFDRRGRQFGCTVDLATILAKSSNVGTAKVALSLKPEQIYQHALLRFGLGQLTGSGYPGESAGMLSSYTHWRPIGIATHVTWLRAVGDAAAAGACLRHHRRAAVSSAPSPSSASQVQWPGEQRAWMPKVARSLIGAVDGASGGEGRYRHPRIAHRATGSPAKPAPPTRRWRAVIPANCIMAAVCRPGARNASQVCHCCGDRRAEPRPARGGHVGTRAAWWQRPCSPA